MLQVVLEIVVLLPLQVVRRVLQQVVLLEQHSGPRQRAAPWASEPQSQRLEQELGLQVPRVLGLQVPRLEQGQGLRQAAEQLIARLKQPLLLRLERVLLASRQLEQRQLEQQQLVGQQQAQQPQPVEAHR